MATHWPTYVDEAEKFGQPVDPDIWRVGRSILITESSAQAEEIINDPHAVFSDYYFYLNTHLKLVEGKLTLPIDEAEMRSEAMQVAKELVIIGTANEVLDQLVEFHGVVGNFGNLMVTGHDISSDPDLWKTSMTTLAQDIAPRFSQHMGTATQ